MFANGNADDTPSNAGTSKGEKTSPTQQQQIQQQRQQQTQQQQQQTQQPQIQQRWHDFLDDKIDSHLWGRPWGFSFFEDPFFTAALPFTALDTFLRDAAADSVRECLAAEQRQQQRCSPQTWRSSLSNSMCWPPSWFSSDVSAPDIFAPEIFAPDIFAPASFHFFRKPWWRPSFWVQQRQLEQQLLQNNKQQPQREQKSQSEKQLQGQQQQQEQQQQQQKKPGASLGGGVGEDEIPVFFPDKKSGSVSSVSLPALAAAAERSPLLHYSSVDPASAAAAEVKAQQMRHLKWLMDPFFADPFSLYPSRFWDIGLHHHHADTTATTTASATAETSSPSVPAASAERSSVPTPSSPTKTPLSVFGPFAAPAAEPSVPFVATATAPSAGSRSAAAATTPAVTATATASALPRVDVRDCGDVLLVDAEVPGFQKEDLLVSIEGGGLLRISGRKQPLVQELPQRQQQDTPLQRNDGWFYLQERVHSNNFTRAISLPGNVKENDVRASVSDGVLHLRIPKAEAPAAKPSRIISIA